MPLPKSIAPLIHSSVKIGLKIETNAPSLTPTAPGDGMPEVVPKTMDCNPTILK